MNIKFFAIFSVAVILIVGGLGLFMNRDSFKPSKLEPFAQCLKASGAEFYGAFWCPHCQEQKKEFGSAAKSLPYIECSNADQTQTQICKDKKIESYPTWIFKDGSIVTGKMELTSLADKTQCVLPQ
ncbi:hypothetical protein HXX01_00825 [Candidatus Nomurabacteria bacterium]|nr:hypothetical protein [Candidatus Nomurabacteria bacterium]